MNQFGTLAAVDYFIIALYFAATIGAGLYFRKIASKGISEYFLGGRKIPWWAIGMSGTASNFDMTGTMVIISFIFAIGMQGLWVAMRGGMCLPLGILMVYMGKWLRRSNVMTTAEWMRLRFGEGTEGKVARLLSAIANLVVTMAFLIYFVKGTGKFLSIYLPFSPEVCALIMIAVAVFYTVISGFFGVIYTDVIQELLILTVAVFVGWKAFTLPNHAEVMNFAGAGWSSFMPNWKAAPMQWLANPHVYELFGLCIVFWIARGIFEGVGGMTGGYMSQRYYAAKNDREAGLLTAEWIMLIMFRWLLVVGAAVLGLSLAMKNTEIAAMLARDPEKTLPIVIGNGIPAGIRGLLIAGLVAAAMSTFDSTLNAGVSYWVRDIYQAHIHPHAKPKQLMRQSHAMTLVFAGVAVLLGLFVKNINEIWSWITGPLAAGLFVPIILRWYWWRLTGYGFAIATGVGLVMSIVLKVVAPDMAFYLSWIITMCCSFAAAIVGSYATGPTAAGTLENFWLRIKPFGLWRPVTKVIDGEVRREFKLRNTIDILNVFFAVAWHLSGVAVMVCLVLRKWSTFAGAAIVFAALSLLLYFTWYQTLQSKQEARSESREMVAAE
jgi:SSS family solute:Na+ symporter